MIVNLDQRSDAWHEWRKGKIGSSDIATIAGHNPYKTALQLYQEKITGKEIKLNAHMRRGVEFENQALETFTYLFDANIGDYIPTCFQYDQNESYIASIDGYNAKTNTLVEIKCPSVGVFEALTSEPPKMYYYQVQWQLMISGATRGDLFFYCDGKHRTYTIYPNQFAFEELQIKAADFVYCLEFEIEPEASKNDRTIILSPDLVEQANLYKELTRKMAEIKAILEEISENLKEETNDSTKALIGPLLITKYERKGTIDYDKIPALKGLDLEPYRKPSSMQTKITIR